MEECSLVVSGCTKSFENGNVPQDKMMNNLLPASRAWALYRWINYGDTVPHTQRSSAVPGLPTFLTTVDGSQTTASVGELSHIYANC